MFELPHETFQRDGKDVPATITKEYTLSLSKKSNLRKHLDSWRGRAFTEEELKGFEVSRVVGSPCQLTIVHSQGNTGNTYAKIESITGLAKGMQCPAQFHNSVKYEIEDGRSDVFKALPEWVQKKIEACEEWKSPGVTPEPAQTGTDETEEDSTPF